MRTENLVNEVNMKRIVEKIKYNIELKKQESKVLNWFVKRHKIEC
jgi:hypothetical protein